MNEWESEYMMGPKKEVTLKNTGPLALNLVLEFPYLPWKPCPLPTFYCSACLHPSRKLLPPATVWLRLASSTISSCQIWEDHRVFFTHAYNSSTQEVEAGGSCVGGQPSQFSETLSQKTKKARAGGSHL
jgi:hypothetical protein